MKKLPILLLGLLILNAVFVFCAFDMGVASHCPFGLSSAGECFGENVIQSVTHHISNMLDSTLAVLPFLVSLVSLAIFAIFLSSEDILYKYQYSLSEIETPTFIPRKSVFKWLSIVRQGDPENSFRACVND